jgi:hypothetical protein
MLSVNRYAFKEWAATCAALAAGHQSLLLRKGGIHEQAGHFEVEHREFWLFPTRFHQNPDEIRDDARSLLQQVAEEAPSAGVIRLALYAVVDEVIEIRDESLLPRLSDLQILAAPTVADRFHYRRPVLFVLPARIYRRAEPMTLRDTPHFAGCRTWVDLERELVTSGLTPVLTDVDHADHMLAIRRAFPTDSA